MNYSAQQVAINTSADCLIVGVFEEKTLSPSAVKINDISQNYLSRLVESGEVSGKLGETTLLRHLPNIAAERVLLVGCGKAGELLNERQYKQLIQKTVQTLKTTQAKSAVNFSNVFTDMRVPSIAIFLMSLTKVDSCENQRKIINLLNRIYYEIDKYLYAPYYVSFSLV